MDHTKARTSAATLTNALSHLHYFQELLCKPDCKKSQVFYFYFFIYNLAMSIGLLKIALFNDIPYFWVLGGHWPKLLRSCSEVLKIFVPSLF